MAKKFGFVKTKSREELLKFILEQSSLIGHGYFRWSKIDFKNNVLIGRGISFMAQNYKKIFGLQKCPIDYFLRGEVTSLASEIFNKNMFCVEMECIAVGNKECVFVAKPLNRWDRNDSQFRNQLVNKLPSIKELANLKTVPL
jgi:predicted hydrocarbon binding protein